MTSCPNSEVLMIEHQPLTICNHPNRDKNNPHGLIYCDNLKRFGRCPMEV
jgi:hypothetical protein